MISIRIQQLTKRFGTVTALQNLDLTIQPGELFFLLGPSGCGKTTLLRSLAGFYIPDGGNIFFGDEDVTKLEPHRRNTGMMFQSYALWPHMTVAENVAFGLEERKVPKDETKRRVAEALESVRMAPYAERRPNQLSGGQQQRVALARALVIRPRCLLLDEPLSNLDARLRIRMRQDIKALHARIGSTIVYVTHDQAEAMTLSTRIAVFSKGRLQQFAPPADIYNNPANLFVAGFVGEREINLFDGKVERVPGGLSLDIGGAHLPLGPLEGLINPTGRRLKVGIRPEGLEPETVAGPDRLAGTVALSELIGPDQILKVTVGDISLDCRVDPRLGFAVGDIVHLRPRQGEIHLFDADTELNVRSQAVPLSKAS